MTDVLRYAAFTAGDDGGNPAGVVLDAAGLDEARMLEIARTVGYSETAFLTPAASADGVTTEAVVRYFSPVAEVAFCGHATVAAAVALGDRQGPGTLVLHTQAGPVTVSSRVEDGSLVATLTSPPASSRPIEESTLDDALAALRWTRDDLDPTYPVHIGFAGVHHLLLAVRDRATLASLDYDYAALQSLMAREDWTTAHLFWAQDPTTFQVRNPFPPGGVVEDPATGAAAAAFGGYLRDLGLVPLPTRVMIHQGHDMGRPSELLVDLVEADPSVAVSGRGSVIAG